MTERLTERQLSALVFSPERMTHADRVKVVMEVRRLRGIIAPAALGLTRGGVFCGKDGEEDWIALRAEARAIREESR